ncbi:hypothetical protein SAV31267_007160 [Streptomyces avermitilis]|uniref:Uncharacterized protein n=1 Tax=Streptomyces avermitilis TaxID=33903 RepID=A0A4D4MGR0_STRAX|nr:hypothetical protein SAV31267_007160 [Streptomyces avermitilis]
MEKDASARHDGLGRRCAPSGRRQAGHLAEVSGLRGTRALVARGFMLPSPSQGPDGGSRGLVGGRGALMRAEEAALRSGELRPPGFAGSGALEQLGQLGRVDQVGAGREHLVDQDPIDLGWGSATPSVRTKTR